MAFLVFAVIPGAVRADVFVQCPGDTNGDAIPDPFLDPPTNLIPNPDFRPYVSCMHLTGGDGFATMGDGAPMYIFGFSDITGTPPANALTAGILNANFAAPTIFVDEGQDLYLTLTNVGMFMRPDLFDPHTVHFHGYGNAATVFDGEPMASLSINMGNSLTYYYNINEPGTYMYHCHVEATEHMQMGMLGNLYVRPAQNGQAFGGCAAQLYAYNDEDGSTCYDVEAPIQIHSFDPKFHEADLTIQPLPFAAMKDTYPMLNGRGYPDTVNTGDLPAPLDDQGSPLNNGLSPQKVNALITATSGQKILIRFSSLATTNYHSLQTTLGVPMKVVGKDARLLRGLNGEDLTYMTNIIILGGGESTDAIVDTTGVAPGTYFLYTTNLDHLSNEKEDFGGMMTEIVIN
jgi:FtsP/CotA-like multicopper oxidase with cupredoxin domain